MVATCLMVGFLIDVAVPADINIIVKERGKNLKASRAKNKLWNIKFVVIPGLLAAYSTKLSTYLTEIPRG